MITIAYRRRPSPALLAVLVVLGLPALAQAQMFPNLWVKRQRPPCTMEEPIYSVYRTQFYGYYPTQWRTFPPDWHLKSPEAVTPAQLQAVRLDVQKNIEATERLMEGEDPEALDPGLPDVAPNPAVRPPAAIPPVPNPGQSPFDLTPEPPGDPAPLPETEGPSASNLGPVEGVAAISPDPLDDPAPLLEDPEVESDTPPSLPPLDGAVRPGSNYAPREDDVPPPIAHSIAPPTTTPRRKTLNGGLFDNFRGKRRR
jgi:hypothetical protein